MKRTATILGIAAVLAVPATASAGNSIQAKPQLKPQISKVHIAKTARVTTARVTTARVTTARLTVQRATAYRITRKSL